MRALLQFDLSRDEISWNCAWLTATIAGRTLLQRHLFAFREAGITEVWLAGCADPRGRALASNHGVDGVTVHVAVESWPVATDAAPTLVQRADTLIDPRVVKQIVQWPVGRDQFVQCVDDGADSHALEAKSPYTVGTPQDDDLRKAASGDGDHQPVGLGWGRVGGPTVGVHIGRHYWHRIWDTADVGLATRKVFLATMKSTDGMYARTNRRVSIPISTILARTPVTPNMVTVFALGWSLLAGWLFSLGSYRWMVLASIVSWVASMLDGVDGELARAKFQASRLGAWLEMVCDYSYYVFIFVGMGVGVYRRWHDPLWLALGAGSAVGTAVSFVAVARWKQRYYQLLDGRDPGLAFQQTVGGRTVEPRLQLHAAHRRAGNARRAAVLHRAVRAGQWHSAAARLRVRRYEPGLDAHAVRLSPAAGRLGHAGTKGLMIDALYARRLSRPDSRLPPAVRLAVVVLRPVIRRRQARPRTAPPPMSGPIVCHDRAGGSG